MKKEYINFDLSFKAVMKSNGVAFSSWLIDAKVKEVKSLETEYLRKIVNIKADMVFRLWLEDDSSAILHLEVQGKGSHRPMKLRMFDYFSRLLLQEGNAEARIYSVVLYTDGAGKDDTGEHAFGQPAVCIFKYKVIHLWRMTARSLLALDNPFLLPLIGQMQFEDAEQELEEALERLYQLEDKDKASDLIYLLAMLVKEKGLSEMIDIFIDKHEIENSSPFIRRLYDKGIDEGIDKGRQQGVNQTMIDLSLESLQTRFELTTLQYSTTQNILEVLDSATLRQAFKQSLITENFATFTRWLREKQPPSPSHQA